MRSTAVHLVELLRRPLVAAWAVAMGVGWAATAGEESSLPGVAGFFAIGSVVGTLVGLQVDSEHEDGGWFGRRALPVLTCLVVVLVVGLAIKVTAT